MKLRMLGDRSRRRSAGVKTAVVTGGASGIGRGPKKGGSAVALSFQDVIKSKYLLLTTFTKDGRPKPTAIWGVPDGDRLLVITDDGSWKVRRIRNTPRVTIARSGALGKPKGEPVEGVARVLPKSETRRVYNAVLKRYWYHAWWFYAHSIARGGIDKVHVGLEIKSAA